MKIIPINDNILIKVRKQSNFLRTTSGIFIANVEQDMTVAEVVAVPEKKTFSYELRGEHAGETPERNDDGSIKEAIGYITVRPGDKVFMEKRFHNDYNWAYRNRIEHTVPILALEDDEYDYFLTKNNDIFGLCNDEVTDDVLGHLYPVAPPKPVTPSAAKRG